jgi:aspartate 1-decarboxylase
MLQNLLKAKLHHAHVTHVELEYEGSCAIDKSLMQAVGILENEQIHIYNLNNGERWVTYAITAPTGSGIISINGAAAHKAQVQDRVIICSFAWLDAQEITQHQPKILRLDAANHPLGSHPEKSCPLSI